MAKPLSCAPPAAPQATVVLNLQGTVIEMLRQDLPQSVLALTAFTASKGSAFLDMSRSDFDNLLSFYRRRGISPRRVPSEILNLQKTGAYPQDKALSSKIKHVLPMRQAAHAAKGSSA